MVIDIKAFYPYGTDEFILPKRIKAYVDSLCHEYKELSKETKLIHLGIAIHQGYDLYEKVASFLEDHTYIDESEIRDTICRYIVLLRYNEVKSFADDTDVMYLYLCEHLNLKAAMELFVIELKRCFSYHMNGDEIEVTRNEECWPSLNQLTDIFGVKKAKRIIIEPTGYKEIAGHEFKK